MLNDYTALEVLVNERQRDVRRSAQHPAATVLERRARRHHRFPRPWRRA